MQQNDLEKILTEYLQQADLTITPEKITQLAKYMEILFQWNKVYNLTAIQNAEEFIRDHILDSLVIGPFLNGDQIIDVGSGAGLPGIPLAIYYPDKQFTLLESKGKKARFLLAVKNTLNLKNVTVINDRAEHYHPEELFTTVVTRAFSSLIDMLRLTTHLCHPNGLFLAMKGQYPNKELAQLGKDFTVTLEQRLSIKGMHKERHIIGVIHTRRTGGKSSRDS